MKKIILLLSILSFLSFKAHKNPTRATLPEKYQSTLLQSKNLALKPFVLGVFGYEKLKKQGKVVNPILTIADFSMSANKERLWVIDMENNKVLYHTLVAHGRNSGEEYAKSFSNTSGSYKSSLGFYVTDHTYNGKHGLSLRLDGVENGFNDQARSRAVVIHGADYVSKEFVKNNGRLGRSLGCPALPNGLNEPIVNTIKDKSCLFIYYPDSYYLKNSKLVGEING